VVRFTWSNGITTEATEITEKNSLSGSVYSVCSVVDFKLTQSLGEKVVDDSHRLSQIVVGHVRPRDDVHHRGHRDHREIIVVLLGALGVLGG
jgi:hypothetical protein